MKSPSTMADTWKVLPKKMFFKQVLFNVEISINFLIISLL